MTAAVAHDRFDYLLGGSRGPLPGLPDAARHDPLGVRGPLLRRYMEAVRDLPADQLAAYVEDPTTDGEIGNGLRAATPCIGDDRAVCLALGHRQLADAVGEHADSPGARALDYGLLALLVADRAHIFAFRLLAYHASQVLGQNLEAWAFDGAGAPIVSL